MATVSKTEIVQSEGGREVTREVELYNLDAIIAVGYFDRVVEETRRLEGNQEPKTLGPGKGRKKKP